MIFRYCSEKRKKEGLTRLRLLYEWCLNEVGGRTDVDGPASIFCCYYCLITSRIGWRKAESVSRYVYIIHAGKEHKHNNDLDNNACMHTMKSITMQKWQWLITYFYLSLLFWLLWLLLLFILWYHMHHTTVSSTCKLKREKTHLMEVVRYFDVILPVL